MEPTKQEVLEHYWGYQSFRYDQADIIDSVLTKTDTLAVMPTGAGKSICYQVPGIMSLGTTLVISPLIALMKDQISGLKRRNISAHGIFSGQSKREQDIILDNVAYGEVKFLFISPERIRTRLFQDRLQKMDINLIVVDEAHCISEWGHDFRPEYRKISTLRELLPSVPVLALTATATATVVEDILSNLEMVEGRKFISSPIRSNLSYSLLHTESKRLMLNTIVQIDRGSIIIYVNTRRTSKEIERHLSRIGLSCAAYHGGMSRTERETVIDQWESGSLKIITATKAFGMGIDKANVRKVIHFQPPTSLEAYVQEAGRAGRDGNPAEAIILYNKSDLLKYEKLVNETFPSIEFIQDTYRKMSQFLEVASGVTEYEFYPFYTAEFCKEYGLGKLKVANALKILHQSKIIHLSDAILNPSKLTLDESATKALIANRYISPKMVEFVKLLLRTYESLFLDYVIIDERHVSKKFGVTKNETISALNWLQKKQVAKYKQAHQGHTVSYLQYRFDARDLPIDKKLYKASKQRMTDAIDSMKAYLNTENCRQKLIADHFDFKEEDCHSCDNCLKKYDKTDMLEVEFEITYLLRKKSRTVHEIYSHFNTGSRDKVREMLIEMEEEHLIRIEHDRLVLNE